MLKTLFYSGGRINRLTFLLYIIGTFFVVMGILTIFKNSMLSFGPDGRPVATPLAVGIYILYGCIQFILNIKRAHDYNMSGIVTFLLLIFVSPIIILMNLIIPGNKNANRYGEVPGVKKELV